MEVGTCCEEHVPCPEHRHAQEKEDGVLDVEAISTGWRFVVGFGLEGGGAVDELVVVFGLRYGDVGLLGLALPEGPEAVHGGRWVFCGRKKLYPVVQVCNNKCWTAISMIETGSGGDE